MTVACVLRSGGDFDGQWVRALAAGVERHAGLTPFVALTDVGVGGVMCLPLQHEWPRWWPKLELFRPGLFEPGALILALDLDTLIVGDLSPFFAYDGPLALLSDFNRTGRAQSGVMLFRPGAVTEAIWRTFTAAPQEHMRRYRGDGEWLHAQIGTTADRLQDLFPGQIVSFKRDCRKAPPKGDVRIVCGHGRPRFSDKAAGWAHKAWVAQGADDSKGSHPPSHPLT